jgi:hypothetical protein
MLYSKVHTVLKCMYEPTSKWGGSINKKDFEILDVHIYIYIFRPK